MKQNNNLVSVRKVDQRGRKSKASLRVVVIIKNVAIRYELEQS